MEGIASLILVSNNEDWEGLYVNGKLVESGHKISRKSINLWTLKTELALQREFTTEAYSLKQQEQGDEFPSDFRELEPFLERP